MAGGGGGGGGGKRQRRRTISAELDVAGVVAVGILELGLGAGEGGAGVWIALGEACLKNGGERGEKLTGRAIPVFPVAGCLVAGV